MATRCTHVQELYRQLHDENCVCGVSDQAEETLGQFASFAHWIKEFTNTPEEDPASCVHQEQKFICSEDVVEDAIPGDNEDDLAYGDVVSSHYINTSLVRCHPEGGKQTDGTAKPILQGREPEKSPCIHLGQNTKGLRCHYLPLERNADKPDSRSSETYQQDDKNVKEEAADQFKEAGINKMSCLQYEDEGNQNRCKDEERKETSRDTNINDNKEAGRNKMSSRQDETDDTREGRESPPSVWRGKELASSLGSSRDWMLLCLTVGKELFEAEAYCGGVAKLRGVMTIGLLDALGELMESDDRLVTFMACKMIVAVLSSETLKKETVTTFLKHHLSQCFATISSSVENVNKQSVSSQVKQDQDNPDESNKTGSHGQNHTCKEVGLDEVSQGQVMKSRVYRGQVDSSLDDPGQFDPCHDQVNNFNCADPVRHLSQGHFTLDQVISSDQVEHGLNSDQVNPGQINHAVFIFDLCRLLLRSLSVESLQSKKVQSQRCKRRLETTPGLQCGRLKGFQTEVVHLLYSDLPDISLSFMQAPPAMDFLVSTVDENHDKDTLVILVSFLDVIHALFKWGPVDPQWHQFTLKMLPLLTDLLKQYSNDLIIIKKILDIFIVSVDKLATGNTHSDQSQPSGLNPAISDGDRLLTVAMSLVDMIVKDGFLDSIPYRSGPVGFGGENFRSSSNDAMEETESGDRPLLRKVCRVTLSTLTVLLTYKNANSERMHNEADIDECFETLSRYICGKLNLPITADLPTWIFELFADQDDCLVSVMLCSLNIHRAVNNLQPPHTFLENQFNPHKIFVEFLETVSHDPSVLLDLLISSETPFLEYFVQYLHIVIKDWETFCHSSQEVGSVDLISGLVNLDTEDEEESDDEWVTDVGRSNISDSERNGYLICGHECNTACCEQEEISPRSKRSKRDIEEAIHLENASSQDCTASKVALVGDQSDNRFSKDFFSTATKIKGRQTNHVSPEDSVGEDIVQAFSQQIKATSSKCLDDVMTTLIRLRLLIERISSSDLFPYPVTPLLRLLQTVEDRFDEMGL